MTKLMKDHPFFSLKQANAVAEAKHEAAVFNAQHANSNPLRVLLGMPQLKFNLKAAIKRKLREFGGNNKYVPH